MNERKVYHLMGADGKIYDSYEKGTLGGYRGNNVYGRLDCPAALRAIASGRGTYEKARVFFADEEAAVKAGFRPCAVCMPEKYREWKRNNL